MERKQVVDLLKRIKYNYNEFIVDDYTITEWYKELKDYELEDVMDKLDQHFRSEQYGKQPPKVYFLTKYLTKERDKAKEDNSKVLCEICNEVIPFKEYDRHYSRCLSVEYLDKNYFILNNNHLDKKTLRKLSQEEFDKKYYAFLKIIASNCLDNDEIKRINTILEIKGSL